MLKNYSLIVLQNYRRIYKNEGNWLLWNLEVDHYLKLLPTITLTYFRPISIVHKKGHNLDEVCQFHIVSSLFMLGGFFLLIFLFIPSKSELDFSVL